MPLDNRTLVAVAALVALVPALVAAMVWRTLKSYPWHWVLGNFLAVVALALLSLRGTVPDWISVVVANSMAVGAALAFLQGIRRFRGFPILWWPECILCTLGLAGLVYFRYIIDNINARIVIMSAVLGGIGIASGIMLLKEIPRDRKAALTITGLIFLLGSAVHLLRGVDVMFFSPVTGLFDASPLNTFFFLAMSMAAVGWSLGFILLTGERPTLVAPDVPVTEIFAPAHSSAVSDDDVREELQKILESEVFRRSAQMERFLRLVVERSLSGRSEELKEYVLGRDVFHRGDDYDPRTDSIVRVEAQRLRQKLRKYYASEGGRDSVLIDLPAGSYAPIFRYLGVMSRPK